MSLHSKRKHSNSIESTRKSFSVSSRNSTQVSSKKKYCNIHVSNSRLREKCTCKIEPTVLKESKSCMCVLCNLEEELAIYFYCQIMDRVFLEDYRLPVVEEICIKKIVRPLYSKVSNNQDTSHFETKVFFEKLPKKSQGRRESVAKKASDTQPNGSTRPGSVSGHRRSVPGSIGSKALPSYDQNIDQASSLQPITEDNLMDTTEKLISTTNFDYDWLVKRDEVFAKIIFKNGNIYEGDVLDKLPHGKGTFWWADGTFYEGEFDNGEPTGTGTMRLPDLTEYTGGFRRGYFHGNGVYNMRTTNMLYSGGWKFGKKEGEGWLLYEPGVWYEGEFRNDLREGKGFSQFKDGSCYEGHYVKNKREGYGAMRWFNNDVSVGDKIISPSIEVSQCRPVVI